MKKQTGRVSEMIMPLNECVSYISEFLPLNEGDIIFTGTPAGVGPVRPGDQAVLSWGSFSFAVDWI